MKCRYCTGMILLSLLTSFCFMTTCELSAKETPVYAPLIEKNTTLIARIDIPAVDFALLSKKIAEVVNPFVDAAVEKKEDRDRAKMSIPLFVTMFTAQYAGVVTALKEANVKELYIVAESEGGEMSSSYLAVAAGKREKQELEKVRGAFASFKEMEMNVRFPFVRHGFVMAPIISPDQDDDTKIKSYIKKRFGKLNTVPDPGFAKSFEGLDGQVLAIATVMNGRAAEEAIASLPNLKSNPMLNQGGEAGRKSAEVGFAFLEKALKDIAGVSYAFDLKEPALSIRLRMKTPGDAENLKKEFAKLSNDAIQKGEDKKLAEGAKKFTDSLAPVINGETMEWKIDTKFLADNREFLLSMFKKAQKESDKEQTSK